MEARESHEGFGTVSSVEGFIDGDKDDVHTHEDIAAECTETESNGDAKSTSRKEMMFLLLRYILYGMGKFGESVIRTAYGLFLYLFLVDVARIDTFTVGIMLAVKQVWDGFTDPVVGGLSDSFPTRFGRRKPWIAFGLIPLAVFWTLSWWSLNAYIKEGVWRSLYFSVVLILASTFSTVVFVPYTAIQSDMAVTENQKYAIVSSLMVWGVFGQMVTSFVVASLIVKFPLENNKNIPNVEYGYKVAAVLTMLMIAIPTFIALFAGKEKTKEEVLADERVPAAETGQSERLVTTDKDESAMFGEKKGEHQSLLEEQSNSGTRYGTDSCDVEEEKYDIEEREFKRGKQDRFWLLNTFVRMWQALKFLPFICFAVLSIVIQANVAVYAQNFVLYATYVVEEGDNARFVLLAQMAMTVIALPVWIVLAHLIRSKLGAYLISSTVAAGGCLMLYFTQPKQLWYFIGACMLRGFGASGSFVLLPSILLDLTGMAYRSTGKRTEATMFAVDMLLNKTAVGLAQMMSSFALGLANFEAPPRNPETLPTQPDSAILCLKVLVAVFPIVTTFCEYGLGGLFFWVTRRQERILNAQEEEAEIIASSYSNNKQD